MVLHQLQKNWGIPFQNVDNSEEGWYSSSYCFTNDSIKKAVLDMRMAFDSKYQPANILISTGHTISLSGKLINNIMNKIVLKNSSVLKISESVIYYKVDNETILGNGEDETVLYILQVVLQSLFFIISKTLQLKKQLKLVIQQIRCMN